VLRRIFGPKRDEVVEEWRKLRNEEHSDLYCSPNIIQVMKSRILRWAGNVACKGRGPCRVLVWEPEGKKTIGKAPGVDGRILRLIFRKWDSGA